MIFSKANTLMENILIFFETNVKKHRNCEENVGNNEMKAEKWDKYDLFYNIIIFINILEQQAVKPVPINRCGHRNHQ